jgi:hypothetical protein
MNVLIRHPCFGTVWLYDVGFDGDDVIGGIYKGNYPYDCPVYIKTRFSRNCIFKVGGKLEYREVEHGSNPSH